MLSIFSRGTKVTVAPRDLPTLYAHRRGIVAGRNGRHILVMILDPNFTAAPNGREGTIFHKSFLSVDKRDLREGWFHGSSLDEMDRRRMARFEGMTLDEILQGESCELQVCALAAA